MESIEIETILGRRESTRLGAVVVADDQPDGSLPTDNRYEFINKETLTAAYDAMVRMPRISRAFNQAISQRATKLLQEHCQPYVEPALAWETRPKDFQRATQGESEQSIKLTPLTDAQFQKICTGQLVDPVRALSDH